MEAAGRGGLGSACLDLAQCGPTAARSHDVMKSFFMLQEEDVNFYSLPGVGGIFSVSPLVLIESHPHKTPHFQLICCRRSRFCRTSQSAAEPLMPRLCCALCRCIYLHGAGPCLYSPPNSEHHLRTARERLEKVTGTYSKDQSGISTKAAGFICSHVGQHLAAET